MVLDILKIQNGSTILDILQKETSDVEENKFQDMLDRKIANEEEIKKKREEEKRELEAANIKNKSNPNSAHNSNTSVNKSSANVTKSSGNITKSVASISKSAVSVSTNANNVGKSSNSVNKSNNSINKSQNELDAKEDEIRRSQELSLSLHHLKESTFNEYKKKALEYLERLEGYHEIKKEDNYQALLNIIGKVNIYEY